MKNLIILLAITASCFSLQQARAQMVNGVKLSEINADYLEITAIKRTFSDKIWISLEYGQKVWDLNQNTYIRDDNKKEMEFNSALDCVNKMKSYGYELFQVYSVKYEQANGLKYYVLKRK